LPLILIAAILLAAELAFGILESLSRLVLCLTVCMAAEAFIGRWALGKWPNLISAYITGQSLGILIRSLAWWPYIVGSLIAILSKYVVRTSRGHLWNPSNLAISILLFTAPNTVNALSWQWTNSWTAVAVIWVVGLAIVWRVKRFHVCAAYILAFLILAAMRTWMSGVPLLAEVAPITGPMYQLFIFFMITDPPTTLSSRRGRIVTAVAVALLEAVLRLLEVVHAPFYALTIVGPSALLIESWLMGRSEIQKERA